MAKDKEKIISKVPAEAFLICDKSLRDIDAPFYVWLRENGFELAWYKGHYSVDWAFVNITHMMFAYGMPGIKIVQPIGNHAITIDEFKTIFSIYQKYEGLGLFAFTEEEEKERNTEFYYVRTPDAVIRRELIEMIEKDGMQLEADGITSRDDIINSRFPLKVNLTEMTYSMLHTTTSAAGAVSAGRVIDPEEFIVYYKGNNCSYEEYHRAIRTLFLQNGYTLAEVDAFFEEEAEFLKESYSHYMSGMSGSSPRAVENCLSLMY